MYFKRFSPQILLRIQSWIFVFYIDYGLQLHITRYSLNNFTRFHINPYPLWTLHLLSSYQFFFSSPFRKSNFEPEPSSTKGESICHNIANSSLNLLFQSIHFLFISHVFSTEKKGGRLLLFSLWRHCNTIIIFFNNWGGQFSPRQIISTAAKSAKVIWRN